MHTSECMHEESHICGLGCRLFRSRQIRRHASAFGKCQLSDWSFYSNQSCIGVKRPYDRTTEAPPEKKRSAGQLTFFEGTFRPLIILDDDDTYPVHPRQLLRDGKSRDVPIVLKDEASNEKELFSMAADGSTKSVTRNDVTSHSTDDSGLSDDASIGTFSRASLFKTLTLELKDDRSFWKYQPTRQPDSGEFLKIKRSRSVPPAHRLHLDSTSLSPPICTELQSVASDYLSVSAAPSKSPRDSMIVQDRKHFLIYKPTTSMIAAMNRWVSEVHAALDPFRSEDECWLHPLPPPPRSNGRAYGTIRRKIQWTDYIGPHFVDVNYGIVALIVDSTLTDAQKEGYIKEAWHLSHLCGNWTCCNWRHFTVEPGAVNISRNTCFMYSKGCNHDPKCLKHLKQRLLPMVREIGNECPRRKSQGEVEGLHSEYIGNECSMDSDSGEDCAIKLRVLQEHEKPLYMAEDRLHDSPPEPDLPVALW